MPDSIETSKDGDVTTTDAPSLVTNSTSTERLKRPPAVTREFLWSYVIAFVVLHLLSLLMFVPWLFSWTGVASVFIGNFVFGSIGINLAYHRLLTHKGLSLPKWLEHFLAILGVCCLQDAPARWVAIHRIHHQHSDRRPDPHSPLVDFFWGHMGWLIYQNKYFGTADFYDSYVRDILRDPFYLKLERNLMHWWIYVTHAVLFFVGGFVVGWWTTGQTAGGVQFGSSMLVWGVFVRTVYVWHITWAVNSVTHRWGYRNYEVSDESRNNWIVGLTTNGEGWHNNHHAYPRCAAHGHKWWELDLTYAFILLLEKLGIAKDVVHPSAEHLAMKAATSE